MMGLEMARLLATPDGRRMVETLKRLVHSQGLPLEEVVRQSVAHVERLEALAQGTGKPVLSEAEGTVRQVADESLDLYERHLERR